MGKSAELFPTFVIGHGWVCDEERHAVDQLTEHVAVGSLGLLRHPVYLRLPVNGFPRTCYRVYAYSEYALRSVHVSCVCVMR